MAICFRLFWHFTRAAASRTFWTAGSNRPIRMAMMAMTTSNSMSVNAVRRKGCLRLAGGRPGGGEHEFHHQALLAVRRRRILPVHDPLAVLFEAGDRPR